MSQGWSRRQEWFQLKLKLQTSKVWNLLKNQKSFQVIELEINASQACKYTFYFSAEVTLQGLAVGTHIISILLVIIAITIDRLSLQTVVKFLIRGIVIGNAHRLVDWLKKGRRGAVAVVSIVLCVIIAIMLDKLSLQTVVIFLISVFLYENEHRFMDWLISTIQNKLGN